MLTESRILIVVAMALSNAGPSLGQTSIGNGGDPLHQLFRDGKRQALQILEDLQRVDPILADQVHPWLRENSHALADDLALTELKFADEHPAELQCPATCACTIQAEHAPVHLSYENCRPSVRSIDMAGQLLVHEALHHFQIGDEALADEIAHALYESRRLSSWRPGAPWSFLAQGPDFHDDNDAVTHAGGFVVLDNGLPGTGPAKVAAFEIQSRSWRQLASLPKRLVDSRIEATGDSVFVVGGYDTGTPGWSYGETGWAALPSADASSLRRRPVTVMAGSKLFLWGGQKDPIYVGMPILLTGGAVYDTDSTTWRTISQQEAPKPRQEAVGIWTGSEVLLWGGSFLWNSSQEISGALYDPDADQWRAVSTEGAPLRSTRRNSVWLEDRLVVVECRGLFTPVVSAYAPDENAWIPLQALPASACTSPEARRNMAAAGGRLVVWDDSNGAFIYHLARDEWSTLPVGVLPTSFTLAASAWSEGELFFYGHVGTHRYPLTGAWRP